MKNLLLKLLWISLRIPAQILLFRFRPHIIAITGSVGKTTTKDAIFWVLNKNAYLHKLGVRKNQGNLNTELGVPLTILGFRDVPQGFMWIIYIFVAFFKAIFTLKYPNILILEMAADKPGDIKYLTNLVKPHTSVITNIGPAHLEAFKSIENIAKEKSILIKVLGENDHAVLNIDDESIKKMGFNTKARVLYFGQSKDASLYIDNIQETKKELHAKVHYSGSTAPLFMTSVGKSNTYAALAAIIIACEIFGTDLIEATKNLSNFKPSNGRGLAITGQKKCIVVDDTYNANPISMQAALDYINILAESGSKKVVILGEMLELGQKSEYYHQEIGKLAGKTADYVLAVGRQADNYIKGAKQTIRNSNNLKQFEKPEEAADYTLKIISKNDIILVKGSRGAKMERAIKILTNK
ncbi:UDP-N-acetylmuramoyl-tripeptide--D-alanyl-D-alanine ligase [Patescibacteria group bacterium]